MITGTTDGLRAADRVRLFDRTRSADPRIVQRTSAIIARVRSGGDAALRALALELDGVALDRLEVPRARWTRALDALEPELRRALERAIRQLECVHRAGVPVPFAIETEPGVVVGRRPDPLGRVGIYVPGGRAAYASSLLMGVVPATIAGVGEIIVCSPPASDGRPAPLVLAAAALAGADRVFSLGGAGAIAALAFGTETVPKVDRVFGPGNAYVAEAKLQLGGRVGIDAPAGPSELLVLADRAVPAATIARELLAQAEHDPAACVVAVLIDGDAREAARRAAELESAIASQLVDQPRRDIIQAALAANGALLTAATLAQAVAFANAYAPEHLLLAVGDPDAVLDQVKTAGAVFLGATSAVVFGDYITGANHVLPTGGAARSWSGLSTADFFRWTSWQRVGPEAARRLARDAARLAYAEDLPAHGSAALAHEVISC